MKGVSNAKKDSVNIPKMKPKQDSGKYAVGEVFHEEDENSEDEEDNFKHLNLNNKKNSVKIVVTNEEMPGVSSDLDESEAMIKVDDNSSVSSYKEGNDMAENKVNSSFEGGENGHSEEQIGAEHH